MAFIETTPPGEAEGDVRDMYERQQAHWGYVPNYAKVFCHRPEIMVLWAKLLSGIKRHADQRRFELVTTAAAHELGSTYCSLAHGKALTEFLGPDDISQTLADLNVDSVSPGERAMMRLARKVASDASSVTQDDVSELKRHGFSDAEVFDVVAMAAGRAFFSKLVEGLGADADAPFLELDGALRESLVVGRPIDPTPVERMPEGGPE